MENRGAVYSLPSASLSGRRDEDVIFLLDRDRACLEDLALQVSHFGYQVRAFSRPEDLLAALDHVLPSAIITEVVFQGGRPGCMEYIAEMRRKAPSSAPVFFLSSQADINSRLQAIRTGCDAYFVKPVNITELIDRLDALTGEKQKEPFRILIVEDEEKLSLYYSVLLQKAGMETMTVNDPLKVFKPLFEFKPDLILMDMYMPACTGRELAKVIRQMRAYFCIPIVFLSAEKDLNKQLSAMSIGGDDFLTKPIEPEHLISSVTYRAERMRLIRSFMDRDSLTGLLNHTKTKEELDIALSRTKREGGSVTFAMLDIDDFKHINDIYGHPAGDTVLVVLSRLLKQRLRKTDVIGRYGGEEFAVVLEKTDAGTGRRIMDEIRASFSQLRHRCEGREFNVTFSCGIAAFPCFGDAATLSRAADRALYRAKEEGKDRVVVEGD